MHREYVIFIIESPRMLSGSEYGGGGGGDLVWGILGLDSGRLDSDPPKESQGRAILDGAGVELFSPFLRQLLTYI